MDDPIPTFEELMARMPNFGAMPLQAILDAHPQDFAAVASFDSLRLAACFGGLLTSPSLQSSCARLEILVHLAFVAARGTRKPNERTVARLFAALGNGPAGSLEDPAEDIFVSLIVTPRGNFRILEGIWESAGFHTQRVMNALEMLPSGGRYNRLRNSAYALLKLSDLVCERAGLVRYVSGEVNPQDLIPPKIAARLNSLRRCVRFTEAELTANGISISDLAEFGFDPATRTTLASERIGHSTLERFPVVYRNGEYHFILPTAASSAIRRFILESMEEAGLRDAFAATLAYEFANLVTDTPLLGSRTGAPMEFKKKQ